MMQILLLAIALMMLTAGCDSKAGATGETAPRKSLGPAAAPQDAPLAEHRVALLELALDAASAIPSRPHIKDRSRMQELVVTTCLKLDQPQRALAYGEKIENWRRGRALADYAFYCAEHDCSREAELHLERATEIAAAEEDWRRDSIRTRIAQTYLLLGEPRRAASFDAGLTDSETGKSHAVRARLIDSELFAAQTEALDALIATGVFDQVRNALDAYAELFDRFYDEAEKRDLVEQRIKHAWVMFPHLIRIELLRALVDAALAHHDKAKALTLVDETKQLIGELNWKAEYRLPLLAHLARQQFLAGDEEGAATSAADALATFHARRDSIIDIYRAGGLRPLAEAYIAMRDPDAARAVYALALDEGAINPNARPRAEDLCATLCSMAAHDFAPDAALMQRIREIGEGLDHPW